MIMPILPKARRAGVYSRCLKTAGAYSCGCLRVNHVLQLMLVYSLAPGAALKTDAAVRAKVLSLSSSPAVS
jgi:hypothetical protein